MKWMFRAKGCHLDTTNNNYLGTVGLQILAENVKSLLRSDGKEDNVINVLGCLANETTKQVGNMCRPCNFSLAMYEAL